GLADTVSSIGRLVFHRRVPPWVEVDDGIGPGEVQPSAAGLEADEENGDRVVGLKAAHNGGAIDGGAVEVAELDAGGGQSVFQECEHGNELAEDEDAVAAIDHFLEQLVKQIE